MWYRVFSLSDQEVAPEDILDHLHAEKLTVTGQFRGDDLGWTGGELRIGPGTPIMIERYLAKEDELRDDLNTWAAWVETQEHAPGHEALMERIIGTRQMVTIRKPVDCPDELLADRVCETICRFLARETDAVWQCDERGFFDAHANMVLPEF